MHELLTMPCAAMGPAHRVHGPCVQCEHNRTLSVSWHVWQPVLELRSWGVQLKGSDLQRLVHQNVLLQWPSKPVLPLYSVYMRWVLLPSFSLTSIRNFCILRILVRLLLLPLLLHMQNYYKQKNNTVEYWSYFGPHAIQLSTVVAVRSAISLLGSCAATGTGAGLWLKENSHLPFIGSSSNEMMWQETSLHPGQITCL